MVVGIIPPNSGKIVFDNQDKTGLPIHERARYGIGYLSQEPSIFRKLTVRENIMAILETLPIGRTERKKRLQQLLEELRIAHLAKNKAFTLSGGERRRLEITRALVTNPSFILLDEPFSGVDPIIVGEVQEIIKELKQKGLGILPTTIMCASPIHNGSRISDRGRKILISCTRGIDRNQGARDISVRSSVCIQCGVLGVSVGAAKMIECFDLWSSGNECRYTKSMRKK
jgi:LPS export ABC transporter ATP-binding protein